MVWVGRAPSSHPPVGRHRAVRGRADVPLRMALGETHVVALTKRALGEAGVNVAALEAAAAAAGHGAAPAPLPRSKTALLVKNLPYASTEAELQVRGGGPGGGFA